ncbi:RdgB/HAM1 family non-canonical purine NTP pyrophosphatase [Aurantimicrobium minutum]|uniref:RdgB/HAM1 family non-canonical purine NTP pyrophosphatase n=1 Tax=Aurantimicrobium minutum TaxID=708131 RepID=UPI0024744016|nr:RdgB/HAM1 family non-canonical purine NTP pyrophosphatase [Aurantimicrobium minutum]MDH6255721.1 XTP/dITP diphosphohydrolase [Aurantimicrobium minutum]
MNTFVLATHNQHKIEEFNAILGELVPGITVIGYDGPEPIEDGVSFAENALIKARAAATHTGLPSLSDDSGICVEVLGGMPGIFSARWAGNAKDNAENVRLLLDQMSDVRDGDRGAYFTCHIAVVIPDTQEEFVVVGNWPGTIAREVHGVNGFGYDPVFIPEGYEVTAAILDPAEKNKLSHRSRALQALADRLSS